MIQLADGCLEAAIDADTGARLTSLRVAGTEVLADDTRRDPDFYRGSFVLAPWCGTWPGRGMHGLVHSVAWEVLSTGDAVAEFQVGFELPEGDGVARLRYEMADDALAQELSVTVEHGSFPVALGFHPWFRAGARCAVAPTARWVGDGGWPRVRSDDLGERPWDDLFEMASDPVIAWEDGPTLHLSSDAPIWVVYEQQAHGFCVEPWSDTDGPAGTRLTRPVETGETRSLRFTIRVS